MTRHPNVLAERYASPQMQEIWLHENRVMAERKLWVEVLKVQKEFGIDISNEDISAYEKAIDKIDPDSIAKREAALGHDVKARLEEFSALAGREKIHLGLTSRDITENIEQQQICMSASLIVASAKASLKKLSELARKHKSLAMVGRTHNVPAQVTTLGRRFAFLGEELLMAILSLEDFLQKYKFRGIKGAIGTQSDLLELFGGDEEKVSSLDEKIIEYLAAGIKKDVQAEHMPALLFTGQVYPRSLDLAFAHQLVQMTMCPANFAIDLRLMAGAGLANEGQEKERVGSSAMPHKANPSLSERISGLAVLARGYMGMLADISGAQWNEGDVSCSVVRRVALPDICFAVDGVFNTFSHILENIYVNEAAIKAEVQLELPFLSSSRLLIAATQAGAGREAAHKLIKEKSTQARAQMQASPATSYKLTDHPLVKHLSELKEFPLDQKQILETIQKEPLSGRAEAQVEEFLNIQEAL